jgi:aerobic-type carbon monoxide dehydrogenase small subunit (CoxS/CutS family)
MSRDRESLSTQTMKAGCGCASCGAVLVVIGLLVMAAAGTLLLIGGAK